MREEDVDNARMACCCSQHEWCEAFLVAVLQVGSPVQQQAHQVLVATRTRQRQSRVMVALRLPVEVHLRSPRLLVHNTAQSPSIIPIYWASHWNGLHPGCLAKLKVPEQATQ